MLCLVLFFPRKTTSLNVFINNQLLWILDISCIRMRVHKVVCLARWEGTDEIYVLPKPFTVLAPLWNHTLWSHLAQLVHSSFQALWGWFYSKYGNLSNRYHFFFDVIFFLGAILKLCTIIAISKRRESCNFSCHFMALLPLIGCISCVPVEHICYRWSWR